MNENNSRIDKFLWSVRLFKTRSLSTETCKKGRVSIDKMPVKASRIVKVGEIIEVSKPPVLYSYKVIAIPKSRMSAKLVNDFIENLTPKEEMDKLLLQDNFFIKRDRGSGRPTKKERRLIEKIKKITDDSCSGKRKENITEYLLYMFQIEDLIRAFNFDIEMIDKNLISQYDQTYQIKRDIREWYLSLIQMMKENDLASSGHIPILKSQIQELNDLHLRTLENTDDKSYAEFFAQADSAIEELKIKSNTKEINDIEAGLNGLYGFLMLKLQKKPINPETSEAISRISQLLAELSIRFHKAERGESEI